MIYYLIFFITGILIDIKDLKNSNKKSDLIFYIIIMISALALAIYYYLDTNKRGIAEYVLDIFNLGGM